MHPLRQIQRKNWPVQLNDLARVISDEAAMNLFVRFNGRHLHIPKSCPVGHVIEKTIGAEKAALLCKEFGQELIIIPKGAVLLRKIRNANIFSDWKQGMTQADIATKYDLTTRRISTIINQNKPHSNISLRNFASSETLIKP